MMKGVVIELKDGRLALIANYQPLKEVDKIILTLVDSNYEPLKNKKGENSILIRNLQAFKEVYGTELNIIATIE